MVVEGPVARLAAIKIDALSNLVVGNRIAVAVVLIRTRNRIDVGRWNERENSSSGGRPRTLRNYAARRDALRRGSTSCETVLFADCDRVSQSVGKRRRPVVARCNIRRTAARGSGSRIDFKSG